MSENPLKGIPVPSVSDIARSIVDVFGACVIDLRSPLQRERLRKAIEQHLGFEMQYTLERAILSAQEKAIKHIFCVMKDGDYQEKKRKRREAGQKKREEWKVKQENERADTARKEMKPITRVLQ